MNITKLPNLTVFADSDSGGNHTEDGKFVRLVSVMS